MVSFLSSAFPSSFTATWGRILNGSYSMNFALLLGVNKSHTTAFHPQSDGQTERMNRTLLQMLKTTADENPGAWPQRLATVMATYRMTVHKTSGITPNMAMLGREVMMPAALIARPPEEPFTTSVPFVSNLRDTLRDAHRRVRNATKSSARSQKSYYDERAHVKSFDVGQLVWLYWPRQVATLVDWAVAHRSIQVATGGGDKTYHQAHKTDGSCGSSALVQSTTASRSRSGLGSPSRF